ncbi:DNA-binding SARP family transcriptional activator [Amycolatopsis bartoniae]|uniref:SARP family transcriptional regulator n=1 Tax=Amycolatopsis bartoniae TaxID=941986 RepID=A0A8H9MCU2_9PSEU|nr:AfsR/SARP family transcriptional regulator [Amycolatopsis bartoniae]MBB2934505.1 DNA-binding SARP family transcriptional activator [Amycolatopsis bartoniae]TVT01883.1 AAA family ATPase [Amycolatopsis bartoniae]GHF46895.1 SARP family transcriptional regulator [Amycolatopsis bartoniae]
MDKPPEYQQGAWRFRLLGRFSVGVGGEAVSIRSRLHQALLAGLLAHPNQVVPADDLIDTIWQRRPKNASNSLHVLVKRLRAALGDPDRVRAEPGGYRIVVAEHELDLLEFTALLERAKQATDPLTERDLLAEALSLWGDGPTPPPLREEDRGRLEELRLGALSRRIALDLETGREAEAISELRRLTQRHPLREGLWAQLMRALHQSGSQAEALAVYAEARAVLADELGVEPGAELRELHAAALAADGAPAWEPVCQLPARTDDFVGREDTVARLERLLEPADTARVVVVWGQPGVGKSTLAVQAAHRLRESYPDGQWFAALHDRQAGRTSAHELLEQLLLASGLPAGQIPAQTGARSAALRARLADRRVLLVLDDAGQAAQVAPALPGTGGCAVLVTSRRSLLDLPGAQRLRIEPLRRDSGVQLLSRMIGAERVEAERAHAEELVRLCGALPLALRIAGARLSLRPEAPLSALAQRLCDERTRLDELAVEGMEVRASLSLTYQGLSPLAQKALRCTVLLPRTGFSPCALGAVTDGSDGERLVEALTANALLEPRGVDDTGAARYRTHDLVALYARDLATDDDLEPGLRGLLDLLLARGEEVYREASRWTEELPPYQAPGAMPARLDLPPLRSPEAWARSERDLLLAAIDQACAAGWHADAARLADLVIPALHLSGGFDQLAAARQRIAEAARAAGDELVAWRADYGRAEASLAEDVSESERTFVACAEAFDRLGAATELVYSLTGVAFCRLMRNEPDLETAERAVRIAATGEDRIAYCTASRTLAQTLQQHGRIREAVWILKKTTQEAAKLHVRSLTAGLYRELARAALLLGDIDAAASACLDAAPLLSGNPHDEAWLLQLRSRVETAQGRYADAATTARRSHGIFTELGDRRAAASSLIWLADALWHSGDHTEAVTLARQARDALAAMGSTILAPEAERILARASQSA